jgi:hypothetical protein
MRRRILLPLVSLAVAATAVLPMNGARADTHITPVTTNAATTINGLPLTIDPTVTKNTPVAIRTVPAIGAVPASSAAPTAGAARIASTAPATGADPIAVAADTDVTLPLLSYFQMAVDSDHDHLFFSQGCSCENSILVTDFSGNTVAAIAGQTGVAGMTLSPDGSTLYAALTGAHEVIAISTATLRQVAAYRLPDGWIPLFVAVQSGKLWVSYEAPTDGGTAAIGDFDLAAANPALQTQQAMGGWDADSPPLIAADPSDTGNVLVAMQEGSTPAPVDSYDTATDPVTVRAQAFQLDNGTDVDGCDNVQDIAVAPGGAQFIPACGLPYAQYRYSTANLTVQGSYPSSEYPDAVAVASGSGTVAAGVSEPTPGLPDIFLYAQGHDVPLNVFDAGNGALAPRGLGLSADGSKLFAVSLTSSGLTLNTYVDLTLPQASLTLTGPATINSGEAATLQGTLTADGSPPAGDSSPLSRRTVTITRTGPGGTKTWTVTTNAGGAFTMTSTPPGGGSYAYTALFSGTPDLSPAAATLRVTVPLLSTSLTVSATPKTSNYGGTVRVTAHLGATYTNRRVEILGRAAGARASIVLANATVNRSGNLTVSGRVGESATFSAVFLGDARYAPTTATASVQTRAAVVMALSGFYASKRVGAVTYRLYHRAKRLTMAAAVAPNKAGECVQLQLEEYEKGVWRDGGNSKCIVLGKTSAIGVALTLARASVGYPYRLRVDYLRGSDDRNLSADSGWAYFIVEK